MANTLEELTNLQALLASLVYPSLLGDQYDPTKQDSCQRLQKLKLKGEKDNKFVCAPAPPLGPRVLAIQQGHVLPVSEVKDQEDTKAQEKNYFP